MEDVEQSIPARFEKIVRMYPERTAIKTTDDSLTYDQLNCAANPLARAIVAAEHVGNEPVAILVEHGAPLIVAIIGILKAGKMFVVIDPAFPELRIKQLLEDSQARSLVTNARSYGLARSFLRKGVDLINIDELSGGPTTEEFKHDVSPESLAALIYTSGSMGRPKGVLQNHRNILHTVLRDTSVVHISPDDRLALLRSSSTSGAIVDLLDGLLNGAAVYPYDILKEGFDRLIDWLYREEITIFNSVSSTFRHFLHTLVCEGFPRLRLLYIGGETISPRDVALYQKNFSAECILVVRMGCGEAGKVCQYMIDTNTTIRGLHVPVGFSHEDLQLFLLDDAGQEVRSGAVGEIAVKSRYLSPGYWHMPDLTNSKFLPDANGGDCRTYLTGDLGLRGPDGCLFHMGRKDVEVKVRGYPVEVVEIEHALRLHDGIEDAAVLSHRDRSGEHGLFVYWVPKKWPGPTVSELRQFIQARLPAYMVPTVFVPLESIPKTSTGKIDRNALPAPRNSRPPLDRDYTPARTRVEKKLKEIWSEVLSRDEIGVHDNFFDLGGHSLNATQVVSRLCKLFKETVPLRIMFEYPTIAELAAAIDPLKEQVLLDRTPSELEPMTEEQAQSLVDQRDDGSQE